MSNVYILNIDDIVSLQFVGNASIFIARSFAEVCIHNVKYVYIQYTTYIRYIYVCIYEMYDVNVYVLVLVYSEILIELATKCYPLYYQLYIIIYAHS